MIAIRLVRTLTTEAYSLQKLNFLSCVEAPLTPSNCTNLNVSVLRSDANRANQRTSAVALEFKRHLTIELLTPIKFKALPDMCQCSPLRQHTRKNCEVGISGPIESFLVDRGSCAREPSEVEPSS